MNRLRPAMQMANGLALDGLARDPEVIRAYTNDPLVHNKISVRLALEHAASRRVGAGACRRVPAPFVAGTRQRRPAHLRDSERRSLPAKVPGDCTLKLWDGFYHETHNEPEKAEVLAFMIDWLQQHTPQ